MRDDKAWYAGFAAAVVAAGRALSGRLAVAAAVVVARRPRRRGRQGSGGMRRAGPPRGPLVRAGASRMDQFLCVR